MTLLGALALGEMPLGQPDDDGHHGLIAESAVEIDQASAKVSYVVLIEAIDYERDQIRSEYQG